MPRLKPWSPLRLANKLVGKLAGGFMREKEPALLSIIFQKDPDTKKPSP
jgi:hypothetical protein